jgi:hypothetical protein
MKKIVGLLLLIALFTDVTVKAQTFTPDSTKFIKEFVNYLGQVNKEDAKLFEKELTPIWFSGKFTPAIRAQVYATTNEMVTKRLKPYPEFKNYMMAVMYAVNGGFTGKKV